MADEAFRRAKPRILASATWRSISPPRGRTSLPDGVGASFSTRRSRSRRPCRPRSGRCARPTPAAPPMPPTAPSPEWPRIRAPSPASPSRSGPVRHRRRGHHAASQVMAGAPADPIRSQSPPTRRGAALTSHPMSESRFSGVGSIRTFPRLANAADSEGRATRASPAARVGGSRLGRGARHSSARLGHRRGRSASRQRCTASSASSAGGGSCRTTAPIRCRRRSTPPAR